MDNFEQIKDVSEGHQVSSDPLTEKLETPKNNIESLEEGIERLKHFSRRLRIKLSDLYYI